MAHVCQKGWSRSRINTTPQILLPWESLRWWLPVAGKVTGQLTEGDSPVKSSCSPSVKSEAYTGNGEEPDRHSGFYTKYKQWPYTAEECQESWERAPWITDTWGWLQSKDRLENREIPQAPSLLHWIYGSRTCVAWRELGSWERPFQSTGTEDLWLAEYWCPKDVQILIFRTCECAALDSEMEFASMIRLRILRWGDYPGFWVVSNVIRRVLIS